MQQGGEVQTISIGGMGPDDKMPLLLQPPLSSTVCHRFIRNMTSVLRLSFGTLVVGVGIRVQDGQSSLHTHSPVIAAALHILHICLALHRLALLLPSPRHLRLPSHASTPPSGSSKYFPSLLFEASMGHGTSCTNHAGLPWGGRSEEEESESDAQKPNLHCFHTGVSFPCQDSHHQSAAGSNQRVWGALSL